MDIQENIRVFISRTIVSDEKWKYETSNTFKMKVSWDGRSVVR
jgi:hypothetical protein